MNLIHLGLATALALCSTLALAHGSHGDNAVWRDAEGGLILSANGECVRGTHFASLNKLSCHAKGAQTVMTLPVSAEMDSLILWQERSNRVKHYLHSKGIMVSSWMGKSASQAAMLNAFKQLPIQRRADIRVRAKVVTRYN